MKPIRDDAAQTHATTTPAWAADVYHQQFAVAFDYPVHFTHNLFAPGNPLLPQTLDRLGEHRRHRAAVFVDSGLVRARPEIKSQIAECFHEHHEHMELAGAVQVVPGGEAVKNSYDVLREVITELGNLHLDRQSFVLTIGGGAVLDMIGFAASLVHRGLRQVRVPTTVLSQNDAGVGVKNGLDEHGQKNFLGTFAPPFAVINDFSFLLTLADRDWIGGTAEAFKVAIIRHRDFFDWLAQNAARIPARNQAVMETLVRRCAVLHLEHIRTSGDPFEFGSARPLDFGHWSAHKIELMTGYDVSHGQAVAIGMAIDCHYAAASGWLSQADLLRVLDALDACGLPTWDDRVGARDGDGELLLLDGLRQFREHLGGRLNVTMPNGIGGKRDVHDLAVGSVEQALDFLRRRNKARRR